MKSARKINSPSELHRQANAGEVVLCGLRDFAQCTYVHSEPFLYGRGT